MLTTRFDEMDTSQLEAAALDFFRSATDRSEDREAIAYNYNCLLPRLNFLKNLPENATLLDLGAGDGGLSVYRDWPLNSRSDIRMLALSLDKGALFDKYDAFELKNFATDPDVFSGETIDAVICCHFIEHMPDPIPTIDFLARRLEAGARVYIEWPHEISKRVPSRAWLEERGVSVFTTRFDDDGTHVETWDLASLANAFQERGFGIEAMGRVVLPHASTQLRDASTKDNEIVGNTLAFWTYFGWAQYLICEKRT